MALINAVILGIVQGITEFLPISSSGHLVIFQEIFGMTDIEETNLLFDVLLHFGTLISIIVVYYKDICYLIKEFFKMLFDIGKGKFNINKSPYQRLLILIILATIPTAVLGLLFKDFAEKMFSSIRIVGISLIITGFLLWLTNKLKQGKKDERNTKYSNALAIGLFQSIAITPGISRSGSTIVGGLFLGFNKEFAIKFSFLISIPAVLGALILHIPDLISLINHGQVLTFQLIQYIIGMITAAVVGILSIKFLINLLNKGKFYLFSFYCWLVGVGVIIYSFF